MISFTASPKNIGQHVLPWYNTANSKPSLWREAAWQLKEFPMNEPCPCGSNLPYEECCGPVIRGDRAALTAEQLMRSRYSAYVMKEIAYLQTSLHPDHRADFNEKSTREWAERSEWHKLDILATSGGGPDDEEGKVEFIVEFSDSGTKHDHHERSTFRKVDNTWYLVDGQVLPPRQVVRMEPKVGRNEPCPCGSGKKYKKCCGSADGS